MSYNPSIAYRGPDPATRSLTDELTARFGYPARPYEFVTGWKDPGNVSGHNPDSNGITHGVDIFMTPAQNRWAADHLAARGRAGDKRVAYVIYAGQIASPSTGFYFAGSGWEHWDHPHLSVWDGYWGGYCSLPVSIYSDTSSWGIATTKPLGTTKPTPIQEDDMSEKDVKEIKNHINAVLLGGYEWGGKKHPGIGMVVEENQRRIGAIPAKVWATTVSRGNGKKITALQELADAKTESIKANASLVALQNVIGQLAGGSSVDYAKVAEAVTKALAESVVKVDVTVAGVE